MFGERTIDMDIKITMQTEATKGIELLAKIGFFNW